MKLWKKISIAAAAMVLAVCGIVIPKLLKEDTFPEEYEQLFSYESISYEGFSESLNYRLYVPGDYDEEKEYPLVLYMHGYGERDSLFQTNTEQLEKGMMPWFFSQGYYKEYACIIVAPQCPMGKHWVYHDYEGSYEISDMDSAGYTFTESIQLCKLAVDQTIADYSVDTDRIYVTGISMGGYGTWNLLTHYPDFFAAAIPVCGGGDPSRAELLRDIPIWCFHGDADTQVPVSGSRDMYAAITAADGTNITYTEWEGVGHEWDPAYCREDVWQWLFAQSKDGTQEAGEYTPMACHYRCSMPRYKNEQIFGENWQLVMGGITAAVTAALIIFCLIVKNKRKMHK